MPVQYECQQIKDNAWSKDLPIKSNPEGDHAEIRTKIEADHEADEKAVKDAGGLFVLASERHESRRIDNQLRGRSGRQGDPGRTVFFLSLEDDLMRIFGSERLDKVLSSLGMEEGEAIVHPWVNKSLERAQAKVEGRNFDIRKQLLKFDDVMNDQRKVIFSQRREIMEAQDLSEIIQDMRHQVIEDLLDTYMPPKTYADQWDTEGLYAACIEKLGLDEPVMAWAEEEGVDDEIIQERLESALEKVESADEDRILRRFINVVLSMLRTNFYQVQESGESKSYLSFKLNSEMVDELPLPRPYREIFVYSPRVEGVHLRGGPVARGGLRWSTRPADFRLPPCRRAVCRATDWHARFLFFHPPTNPFEKKE